MLPPRSTEEQFADALRIEVGMLQAQFPHLAERLTRAKDLIEAGRLFVEDTGTEAMVQSKDGTQHYAVNGQCVCKAAQHRNEVCYHRLALRLYQKVGDRLAADQERYTIDLDGEARATETPQPTIKPEWLVTVQGKPFIRFEGLLELAHARGLVSLETTIVSVSEGLAVCQCVARFADGRTFCDVGDASQDNVAKHLRPHFIRMSATRASARTLRRALNISACSVEELGEEVAHG